jgi:hypothetical protein
MSKVLLSTLVAALVCVAVSNAKAADGISANTLSAMGISGMKVMSDTDALAIRGKGFIGICESCGRTEPSTRVFGNSFATMNLESCPDCVALDGNSHSENGYIAEGPFYSAGTNFSEAGASFQTVESVDVGGVITSVTNTTTARVFAGGFSTARAF